MYLEQHGSVKVEGLFDRTLQCKTKLQYLNRIAMAIVDYLS